MTPRTPPAALAIVAALALGGCSATLERVDQGDDVGETIIGRVVRVADGDTITVLGDDGQRHKVRLLAIDTPESYATRYGYTECGGQQAKKAMQTLVASSPRVKLTTDPTQDQTDRYGRLLAYVAPAAGGETFQATLTRRGWAEVYRFNERRPPRLARKLDPLATAAKRSGAGVWRSCGGFHVRQN